MRASDDPTCSRAGRWARRGSKIVASICTVLAALSVMAWLAGVIISDRYGWSQWLLWIPTVSAIAVAVIGLISTAIWPRRKGMLIGWGACIAALVVYFCFIEYRMFARPPSDPPGLRIVHWNATPEGGEEDDYLDALIDAGGDITITTDAGSLPYLPRIWVWNGGTPVAMRPFAIMTKLPILQRRHLVHQDEIVVGLLVVDTTKQLGRPLTIYIIDMPSDLKLSRAALARRAREMIDNVDAPVPDLVIGDFNITRGAASLQMMFPGMQHAYDQAGSGYSATFHRGEGGWLMYHIDHVLLSDSVRATSYEIIDPGVGRHTMQAATIVLNESSEASR